MDSTVILAAVDSVTKKWAKQREAEVRRKSRAASRQRAMMSDLTITELITESHATAVEHGWWDGERSIGDQFSNFHAEVSEAWEEYRKYGMDPEQLIYTNPRGVEGGKPEGIAVELADLLIRIADTCGKYGIPLERALRMKMAYNKGRPYRHGNLKA